MIWVTYVILAALLAVFGALAFRFVLDTRRALRTGSVRGLFLGRKLYTRADSPAMFWANLVAGFFGGALGAIVLLWIMLIFGSVILAHFGQPTL